MEQQPKITPEKLKEFGLLVGGLFLLIGFWPLIGKLFAVLFNKSLIRLALILAGCFLVYFAARDPMFLEKPYQWWMVIGSYLGWFNTRVLLGIIFYGLFTPLGYLLRKMGHDPLARAREANVPSYKSPAPSRDPKHMETQF